MNRLAIEPGSSSQYHTGDWRIEQPVYHDKWPPCSRGCPAAEDIQTYLSLAGKHKWELAWRKLCERNPFPAVMGRICYHPCEYCCNRKQLDEAVNIQSLERFIGDLALEQGWQHQREEDATIKKSVAIIGAGPAGLSGAYHLRRHGYEVTIFESSSEAGGILRWGIPNYRLPKTILELEIQNILALGINLRLNTTVGEDISLQSLNENFAAIFVAIGAQQARLDKHTNIEGHNVEYGLDFLRQLNQQQSPQLPKNVAVIGGGNTAIDVARSAHRLGSKVTIVCPQDRHGTHPGHTEEEMSATASEVADAEAEGIVVLSHTGVVRLVRNGQHLSGIELAKVDHVYDHRGHFSPVLYEGTEQFLIAKKIFLAIGQKPNWQGLYELEHSSNPSVFVGGDAAGQPRMATAAVGSGYEAAQCIRSYLTGVPITHSHNNGEIAFSNLHTLYYPLRPRRTPNSLPLSRRAASFNELIAGLKQSDALYEAGRCLNCGSCFQCNNCWHFCPDAAIIKTDHGYEIDYDYCKGCGICAQECPSGHIDMEPAPI